MAQASPAAPKLSPLARSILLLFVAYVVLCIIFALTAPNFVTRINIVNILRQASMVGVIGVGMTMVIVAAEIDLSVGAVAAFCGIIVAYLAVNWEWPLFLAIPAAILVGVLAGAFIALLRLVFNIPSFITSLALLTGLRSAAFLISGGYPIGPMPPGFTQFANGYLGPIPYLVLIMIVIYAIGWVAMTQTAWGRAIYAVGGNEEAARLSGISVGWTKLSVLMVNSGLAALAGIMLVSRLNSGTPTVADGWELDVIAAVIIGGTSLFGGAGSVIGTLLGAVFMSTLKTGMVLLGVSPYSQGVVSGVVILVAVLAGSQRLPVIWHRIVRRQPSASSPTTAAVTPEEGTAASSPRGS
jgi:ribose/xylose/arabinose/galactoside ABC-type transport system permease subunit